MAGAAVAGVIAVAGGWQAANVLDARRNQPEHVLSYHVIDEQHLQVLGEYSGCERFHHIDVADRARAITLTVIVREKPRVLFFPKRCPHGTSSVLQVVDLPSPLAGRPIVQGKCPEAQPTPPTCQSGAGIPKR